MRVLNVFLAWTGASFRTVGIASVSTARAQRRGGVHLIRCACARGDHLDLLLAAIHWPVLSSCTDDFDLLQEVALVPTETNLCDLVILVKMYEVGLYRSVCIYSQARYYIPLAV